MELDELINGSIDAIRIQAQDLIDKCRQTLPYIDPEIKYQLNTLTARQCGYQLAQIVIGGDIGYRIYHNQNEVSRITFLSAREAWEADAPDYIDSKNILLEGLELPKGHRFAAQVNWHFQPTIAIEDRDRVGLAHKELTQHLNLDCIELWWAIQLEDQVTFLRDERPL